MPTKQGKEREPLDPDLVNAGILALLIAAREDAAVGSDKERRKTEVILLDVGFPIVDIAHLTGKEYQAVRSVLRRSRASAPESDDNGA